MTTVLITPEYHHSSKHLCHKTAFAQLASQILSFICNDHHCIYHHDYNYFKTDQHVKVTFVILIKVYLAAHAAVFFPFFFFCYLTP